MKSFIQIGFGVVCGIAIAMLIGSGGLWLAAGIGIGIVIGIAMAHRKNRSAVSSAELPPYENRVGWGTHKRIG